MRYIFGILVFLSACQPGEYQAGQLPEQQLIFGNGGGFAGAYEEYLLLDNGQFFHRSEIEAKPEPAGKVSKRKARRLFNTVQTIDALEQKAFEHPGNIYYFVEWKDAEDTIRWVWGDPEYPVDEEVASLYERLRKLPSKQR